MSTADTVFRITDTTVFDLVIAEVDAAGNPLSGPLPTGVVPVWTSSDPTVVTVTVGADPMTATVTTTGKLGPVQVSVKVPSDPKELTGLLNLEVVTGAAASLTLTPTNLRDR